AARELDQTVSFLRSAQQLDQLPLGLLARAAHYRAAGEFTKAQHDLDEIPALTERSGMLLHTVDYHLEKARLLLAQNERTAAWAHYSEASHLVGRAGYFRRSEDLRMLRMVLSGDTPPCAHGVGPVE